jgi:hypothetical protein
MSWIIRLRGNEDNVLSDDFQISITFADFFIFLIVDFLVVGMTSVVEIDVHFFGGVSVPFYDPFECRVFFIVVLEKITND